LKETFDLLIQKITQGQDSKDILEARRDYQKISGEIYEDDRSYEARMGLFLEWYVFDRKVPGQEKTPLELFVEQNGASGDSEELKKARLFSDNINGIFVVKKIRNDEVVALNLLDAVKYNVKEDDGKLLFHKNDLFEGRIVKGDGSYYFSPNFCFHPQEAEKYIKSEVKKIASTRDIFVKELKVFYSDLKALTSRLDKNRREVEKINGKVQKTESTDKIRSLNAKLETAKKDQAELNQQISNLEALTANHKLYKIKNEINELITRLLQKLGYMNLKWERSRQIDLHDIYCN
jgi:flagellar motility protein MotE (MotC chaperone)